MQGPLGLVEQRSEGQTSFPLPDAHGDVTTLADAEGAVASRQSYDPWGAQLSGPALQMGYLGAQQRRSDPATGLVQMGVRPYDPSLGSFIAEDPVLGHVGFGASTNRYAYVWNNPLLYFDLMGRDILDPFRDAGEAIADTASAAARAAAAGADAAWDATAGARTKIGVAGDGNGGWANEAPGFLNDRARDFAKVLFDVEECLIDALLYELVPPSVCHDQIGDGYEAIEEALEAISRKSATLNPQNHHPHPRHHPLALDQYPVLSSQGNK